MKTWSTRIACSLFSVALLSIPSAAFGQTPTLDSEQSNFLTLINNYRSQNGLGPLQVSVALQNSSQWMSNDMATKNYFSHTDSLGRNPFTRMAAFNYPYSPAGENLAAGYSDGQNNLNGWINACDPDASGACTYAHRQNMLNASYTVIGIGRAYNASSTYKWYWTTDFGGVVDQTLGTTKSTQPTADSVTPNSGSGTTQTFTFKYSSPNGYSYLSSVSGLINTSTSTATACYFQFTPASKTLYLYNDQGTAVNGTLTSGSGTAVSNSQCTITGFTVSGSGNQLTVGIPVKFGANFTGAKNLYGYAADQANQNSGWQTLGTWTPSTPVSTATGPTADSVTPNAGSGASQTFTFKYSSPSGYGYLTGLYGVINNGLNGAGACYFEYYTPNKTLYLVNDAGTAFSATVTPGSASSISNSQCTIKGTGFTVTGSGNQLTISIPITFSNTFTGAKSIYGNASDQANQNSGWKTLGTWTH